MKASLSMDTLHDASVEEDYSILESASFTNGCPI